MTGGEGAGQRGSDGKAEEIAPRLSVGRKGGLESFKYRRWVEVRV